jgi:tetratricopeptide (TPR) repeat protein
MAQSATTTEYYHINPQLRRILALFGLLLLLGLGAWLGPKALGLYYQVRGGTILERYVDKNNGNFQQYIACALPPLEDESSRANVQRAINELEASIRFDDQQAHSYLLLGRAHCKLGEVESAVDYYRSYVEFKPDNPLGYLELGFAYETLCMQNGRAEDNDLGMKTTLCADNTFREEIKQKWLEAGADFSGFLNSANSAFQSGNFSAALLLFNWAETIYGQLSDADKFGQTIASILTTKDLPDDQGDNILPIHQVDGGIKIEAETLKWVNPNRGKAIDAVPVNDILAGVLFFTGCSATGMRVDETGLYRLTIRAQNSSPAPIQIKLELNFEPLAFFDLVTEDQSWQDMEVTANIVSGKHVLNVCFLNDESTESYDRNAIIDWIIIERE